MHLRQAAHDRIVPEEMGVRHALRFAATAEGDHELAWRLFIRFGVALMVSYAQPSEVLDTYALLSSLPAPADPVDAARALGMRCWAQAALFDDGAASDLEAVCALLESAGERDFQASFQTARGTVVALSQFQGALTILDHALKLARDAGQTTIENWALMTICYRLLQEGAVDEAAQYVDDFANIGPSENNDESRAYALGIAAQITLMRGDLDEARLQFADAVSLSRTRSAAWARLIALSGLASATLAAGDDPGARAILEEVLLFCSGMGYVSIACLCGATALLLAKSGEYDRALRVFAAVGAGAEDDTSYASALTDPSGALRAATREARTLLGDPKPHDLSNVDFDELLQAVLGRERERLGGDR
jgi:tetratricopeptide (TPR) repeat protein